MVIFIFVNAMRNPFFHIDWHDLVALGTLLPGLTMALLLLFSKKKGSFPLALALFLSVLKTGGIISFPFSAVGPLLYWYVRTLTLPGDKLSWRDGLHGGVLLFGCVLPFWCSLIVVMVYLYYSLRLIQEFYVRLRPVLMDRPRFAFRDLERWLWVWGLFCLLALVDGWFLLGFVVMLMGMAGVLLLRPERELSLVRDRSDEREKGRLLREVVAMNRYYEDPDLTLAGLAVKLMMHPQDLSRVLNVGLDKNFNDFIGEFRVREVCRRMKDPAYDHLTLAGLAYGAGFNSERTFHRVFKEVMGKTPLEYKNELPKNNLATRPAMVQGFLRQEKLRRHFMLKNYLKIAYRNVMRTRTFSAINIAGMMISLAAFMLMALYIEYEYSYDHFHHQADRIYRVVDDKQTNALMQHGAGSAAPVGPALKAEFPQVAACARILKTSALVKQGPTLFQERNIWFADAAFFSIFDFGMERGDPATALSEPMSVVLTRPMAQKYFGSNDAVGKTLLLDGKSMKVTGICEQPPVNSHLSFDMLISMSTAEKQGSGYAWLFSNWYSNEFYTYILLPRTDDAFALSKQLSGFATRHQKTGSTTTHHFSLEKLTDIYLRSDRENQAGATGNIRTLYVFSAIAIFILLISCINFINLSTARAAERAKEVGVKKVNGVSRGQLINQFFTESFFVVALATAGALALTALALPAFNGFSGKAIRFDLLTPVHLLALAAIVLLTSFLSGAYPALVLSAFDPITALKGNLRASMRSVLIRKGLVIFQFVISIVLIVSSIIVYSQLRFMQHHDLGFKPDQTLVINFEGDNAVKKQYQYLEQALRDVPGVKSVSASSNVPGDLNSGGWSMDFARRPGDTVRAEFPVYLVDFNFMKQYGIQMIAGRAFSPQYSADTSESILINETALKKLGISDPQQAIGITAAMYPANGKIIGVFRDFHFESLQKAIQPMAMRVFPDQFNVFSLQISTADLKRTMAGITQIWAKSAPQRPLEYSFLDDSFNRQYQSDIKFGQLFGAFTMLAILIACFGLFGLALFSVRQRTKEIGIRKVVGASVTQITSLLSVEFIKLVCIAILFATPLAWYIMSRWIEGFAYRINIAWWMFALGGLIAILIALATVGYQSVRAAIANPVKSLRTE